jgi:hypothetical protein
VTFELDYKPLVLASLRGMGDRAGADLRRESRRLPYSRGQGRARVRLISRNGRDHTRRFAGIAAAIAKLSARSLAVRDIPSCGSWRLRAANARERAARLQTDYNKAGEMKSEANSVTIFTGRGFSTERYVRLPDTVDPRGPKGE